jgi:hypothetical protein
MTARSIRDPMSPMVCIGCGCDDYHACVDALEQPCSWVRVDPAAGLGVCSACPKADVARWDRGNREPNAAASKKAGK